MNKIIKYSENIMFIILIILSILAICNLINIEDDIVEIDLKLIKSISIIFTYIATVQYILKIIGRLKIKRKKLIKSKLYVSKDIVQMFRRLYLEKIKLKNIIAKGELL